MDHSRIHLYGLSPVQQAGLLVLVAITCLGLGCAALGGAPFEGPVVRSTSAVAQPVVAAPTFTPTFTLTLSLNRFRQQQRSHQVHTDVITVNSNVNTDVLAHGDVHSQFKDLLCY